MIEEGILPRRVLIAADSRGGVWHHTLELARGLRDRGVLTIVAVLGLPLAAAQRQAAMGIDGLILTEGPFAAEWLPGASAEFDRAGDWLLDLEARYTPDLIHVSGLIHAALAWRAPVLATVHSCVRGWWQAVRGTEPPADFRNYLADIARGLAAADMIATPTEAMLGALERLHGPLPHGRVIHHGRSPGIFQARPKEGFVFTSGRLWDEAKNIAALDLVAPMLDWPVVVAGDRRCPDGSIAAAPLNMSHVGLLDEKAMAEWLGRAAVYALPARFEPVGLAVLEAAMAGCALVLGDIATLREQWTGAAVFVDPNDSGALTDTLRAFARDPARLGRFSRLARARARQYSARHMVSGYCCAYSELIHPNVRGLQTPAGAGGMGPG